MNVNLTGTAAATVAQLAEDQGWTSAKALGFIIEFYAERVDYMESEDFEGVSDPADYGVSAQG